MNTSLNFITYIIYLPIVIILTWYVAHILFKNGKTFMEEIFHGKTVIAHATNKLFETGFYLLNLGFALMFMQVAYDIQESRGAVEVLSTKIGGFSIYLGIMLFFNLYLFFRGRRISKQKARMEHNFTQLPNYEK